MCSSDLFNRAVVHNYSVQSVEASSVTGQTDITVFAPGDTPSESQIIKFSIAGETALKVGSEVVAVRITKSGIGLVGELLGRRRVEGKPALVVRKIAVVTLPHSSQPREDLSSYIVYV